MESFFIVPLQARPRKAQGARKIKQLIHHVVSRRYNIFQAHVLVLFVYYTIYSEEHLASDAFNLTKTKKYRGDTTKHPFVNMLEFKHFEEKVVNCISPDPFIYISTSRNSSIAQTIHFIPTNC